MNATAQRTRRTAGFFLVGDYDGEFMPVHLSPYTKVQAEQSRSWQKQGDPTGYVKWHICTPHPTQRGAFLTAEGKTLEGERGGWTPEAWERFLSETWGDEG